VELHFCIVQLLIINGTVHGNRLVQPILF